MTQADADNKPDRHEQEHFFSAAKSVAGLTMASRVLGFIRDMVLVPLGVPAVADVFWTAFGIPHMFRRLFGEGALSAAFVPVFTDAAETGGPDRARKVLANTAGLLAVVLTVLVAMIELGLAGWLMHTGQGPAGAQFKQRLAIEFTMIMLPFAIFICLLALCSAALNAKGHFAYPAAAPILLNVGLIFTAVVLAPALAAGDVGRFRIVGAALVACSVAQLAGAVWLVRRSGLGGRWHIRPILPEMRQIAWRMLPTVLPLGLVQIGDQLMRIIALALTRTEAAPWLPLLPGVVRGQYLSGRLYQLPLGVLAISIATAVFPLMSRCAARGDLPGLREAVNRALRLCLFLSIPSGVALIILAHPTVAAGFQRGDFTAGDTAMTARMLQMYCLGMPAYFCTHILLRAFFSRKDTRTPMYAAVTCTALSLAMVCAGIYTPLRSAALGLATSIAATINVAWLMAVLHRKVGKLGMWSLLTSAAKTAAATAAMAGAIFAAQWAFGAVAQRWLPLNANLARVAVLIGAILAGSGAFLAAARMLACRELGELARRAAKQKQ